MGLFALDVDLNIHMKEWGIREHIVLIVKKNMMIKFLLLTSLGRL